jgi:hypothetical protein
MQNILHRVLRIASAVALDMFRPLRLDFGAEATADRLVERCEVVARDRLARTPTLAMVSPGATTFFRTTRRWPQCPTSMTGIIGPTCCSWHQAVTGVVRAFDSIHLPFPLLTRPCFFIV